MRNGKGTTKAHILVLVPNWLGDVVMCTPALRALRQHYPEAKLSIAGRSGVCDLLKDLTWIDHREIIPEKPSLTQMIRLAARLRASQYDLIVIFPHSFRTALLARLIGGRQRIGYKRNGRHWLLTRTKEPYREEGVVTPIYMTKEYVELVTLIGCKDDNKGLELGLCKKIVQAITPQLAGNTPIIGIAPGAAFGPSKRWPPEKFAQAINQIASEMDVRFILLTGPKEESIRETIKAATEIDFIEPQLSKAGIAELKVLIAQIDLLICNDSGPRHIAIAFKRPVICIMGSTSPRYSDSPYEIGEIVRLPLPCSPCQKPICPLKHHRCMQDITPEQIAKMALQILQPPPHTTP
ncbi:MAG: lipopolysaccharide heptosyltransferase II [Candidatus Hydrogenedentes bacterium]|nr:lipopolysaccharide heptosyltransferase II [Candidatus Hydrogenedentota bacterium]